MSCEGCEGLKYYPIHNRHGREIMVIDCPVCDGDGWSSDERAEESRAADERARYERAMAEMRPTPENAGATQQPGEE